MKTILFSILSLFFIASVAGQEPNVQIEDLLSSGITIDLRNPCYNDGVLTTESGGVITAPNVRIQAQHMIYTKKNIGEEAVCFVEAEGDLVLEFGEYLFVGEYLEYDFKTRIGVIYNGRTAMEPWYFAGEQVYLYPDGTYVIEQGYITTSQQRCPEWMITTESSVLSPCKDFYAKDVQFLICDIPVFWLPCLNINLDTIFDNPIRYSFRWGGKQGPRIGMTYEIFEWNRWKTFVRFDYRITRGPGGGFETRYRSEDHNVYLETINYVAKDSAIQDPHESIRYRFQGRFENNGLSDNISIQASWDKLSDIYMATDYNDKGLELDTAGRTQFHLRHTADSQITNFWSRIRVNNFDTIKEELPSLESRWHPIRLGNTGIIFENKASAGYLDFKYTKGLPFVSNYESTRFEYANSLYRPFQLGHFKLTPELGGAAIFYGNTPSGGEKWLLLGDFKVDMYTRLTGFYGDMKHVIQPYINYRYLTFPTSSPSQHYIFDTNDGWYRLNQMRLGIDQNLYCKNTCGFAKRAIGIDLYTYAFFDTETLPVHVPKGYADIYLFTTDTLRHTLGTAWDFRHGELDHFNFRTEWTLDADTAIAIEYRHRDAFDWRKADHHNFILDSYRSERELEHSALSDRRDTLLLHLFYRLHPNWAFQLQSRHGWNRKNQPYYNEFEFDLLATLPSAWNLKMSYQHKEVDDRVAFYVSIGLRRPDQRCCTPYCLDF